MKILKNGRKNAVKMICPYCNAELLVSARDVESVEIGSGWTEPSVTCPCCDLAFWTTWEEVEKMR